MRRTKAEQRKVYAALDAGRDRECEVCHTPNNLDHSHCWPQGNYPEHRNNPLNILDLCRTHHDLFEHHKADFAREYPVVYAETLRRMELVDPQAFQFYLSKNPPAGAPTTQEGSRRD